MTVYKITISLPSRAAEHVKRAVRHGRATSASAYIAAAIEEKANAGSFRDLLAEMLDETGGPMTGAERRETDRLLGVTPAQRRALARKKLVKAKPRQRR